MNGIWVRSQDKKSLFLCSRMTIDDDNDICEVDPEMASGEYEHGQYRLGRYPTEQRALEVMDEMQKAIRAMLCDYAQGCGGSDFNGGYFVYQMPAEQEDA